MRRYFKNHSKLPVIIMTVTLMVIIVGVLVWFSKEDKYLKRSPQQVVEDSLRYMSEKNVDDYLKTLSENQRSNRGKVNLDSIENIKIININEENDPNFKKSFLSNGAGRGTGIIEDNVKVYRVEYDVKYSEGAVTAQDSGKDVRWFFVMRKDDKSPWLIGDSGY
jgi:hypothetical protein